MNALTLTAVSKKYSGAKVLSLDNVTLSVKKGEVVGFLGSNGAGKSTTIRMIMGFISPTTGEISVLGETGGSGMVAARAKVGYLAGDVALPKKVTGRALLKHLAGLSGGVDEGYFNSLVDRFEAQLDKKVETLSKGNRQKIGLIQAFMHQPDLIVLDEPTSGLDPLMQEEFFKLVEESKARGAAVFVSSHNFSEVERICDRVGIIREGKLVHEGPVSKMVGARMPSWRVTVKKKADAEWLAKSPALKVLEHHDKTLVVEPVKAIQSGLAVLAKVEITAMTTGQQELEDEFMSFYGEQKEDA